ncbi:MAG: efflux RND transporter periplasmic adaptor subunit [Xanthomonadales bacterium]|nr:efflux RND transporter periplasmic adaptor subunit [Xanthomonadales bacterium]
MRAALALPLVVALLAACAAEGPPGGGRGEGAVPVVATRVTAVSWQDSVQALGTAQANESVTITAKVADVVTRVAFRDGEEVAAGQLLVALSDRAEVAQLEEAQAALVDAERQHARTRELVQAGMLNASALDQQTALRDAARARVEALRARLADRVITAPFAGVLGLRRVSPGSLVAPGTPITTLDDVSRIKLDFSIPETFLAALAVGQEIRARSAAYPDRAFRGTVRAIDSRVDPVTRTITVRAELPNPERLLRPGMLLVVELLGPPRRALVLPELAVFQIGSRHYAFRIDEETMRAEQRELEIGGRRSGEVEVREGLAEGDLVVVEGALRLRTGSPVRLAAPPSGTTTGEGQP